MPTTASYFTVFVTLAVSGGKHNVTVWRPSVCPACILTVIHQGAACDAAGVHVYIFRPDNNEDGHTVPRTYLERVAILGGELAVGTAELVDVGVRLGVAVEH